MGDEELPVEGGISPEAEEQQTTTVSDDADEEQASPEEQAAYEEFVKEGYRLLYEGGEVKPGILKLLDDEPTDLKQALGESLPADSPVWTEKQHIITLAATTVVVTLQVVTEWKEREGELPVADVVFHGGAALLEDLAELAAKRGMHDYSEEEIGEAFRMAADIYREAASAAGLLDMEPLKAEWDELVAADKEGRVGDLLPPLRQFDEARSSEKLPEEQAAADDEPVEEEMPTDPAGPRGVRRGR